MPFKKLYLKSKPVCKVTFKLSKEEAKSANSVNLVGDFNDWDIAGTPMKKLKNGSFSATVELAKDANYEFRYLLDDKLLFLLIAQLTMILNPLTLHFLFLEMRQQIHKR